MANKWCKSYGNEGAKSFLKKNIYIYKDSYLYFPRKLFKKKKNLPRI